MTLEPPAWSSAVGMLFGHVDGGPAAISSWLHCGRGIEGTNPGYSTEHLLKFGIASLLDERLGIASKRLSAVVYESRREVTGVSVLARIALAMLDNRHRQLDSASLVLEDCMKHAAETLADPLLTYVARLLWILNQSDKGALSEQLQHQFAPRPVATGLDRVLAVAETLVRVRLFYRAGSDRDALHYMESFVEQLTVRELEDSPIVLGNLIRMRGILHTFCGNPATAREDLRRARKLFEQVGCRGGVIRSTLSIARSNLFLDMTEAERELVSLRRIFEEDRAEPNPREMKAEQADLESRLGDLCYLKGDLDGALRHYHEDHRIITKMGAPRRAVAHVSFSLGRAYMILERHGEAVDWLRWSMGTFLGIGDRFNALRSGLALAATLIDIHRYDEAEIQLAQVHEQLRALPTPRPKQAAMAAVLEGLIDLRKHKDHIAATGQLDQASRLLAPFPKDSYFIRVLLAQAEVSLARGEGREASLYVAKALRLSSAGNMADMTRKAQKLAEVVGDTSSRHDVLGQLQRRCLDSSVGHLETSAAVMAVRVLGYTDFAERVLADSPTMLAYMLTELCGVVAGCAEVHDGEFVRFDGSSVVVAFEDHLLSKEIKAVQAALLLEQRFRDLRAQWVERYSFPDHSLRSFGIGIGIDTGKVAAGHFGRAMHRDFAVVGGPVNRAFVLARSGRDGLMTVSPAVHAELRQSWGAVQGMPLDVQEGPGRSLRAYQIKTARLYPPPHVDTSLLRA